MWYRSLFLFQFAHVLPDGLVYFLKASQITFVFVGHGIHEDFKKVWLNKAWPMRMTDSTTSFTIDLSYFQLWYRQSWRKIHRGSDGNRLRFVAIDERFLSYGPNMSVWYGTPARCVFITFIDKIVIVSFITPRSRKPKRRNVAYIYARVKGSYFHVLWS